MADGLAAVVQALMAMTVVAPMEVVAEVVEVVVETVALEVMVVAGIP